jgi:hypothetical protein
MERSDSVTDHSERVGARGQAERLDGPLRHDRDERRARAATLEPEIETELVKYLVREAPTGFAIAPRFRPSSSCWRNAAPGVLDLLF